MAQYPKQMDIKGALQMDEEDANENWTISEPIRALYSRELDLN